MNNQFDAKRIPKFVYLLLGTIVALVVFVFLVGMPLINDSGAMKTAHKTVLQDIRKYDNAISRKKIIEAEIERNQQEFEKQEKEIFIDMESSSSDIDDYCRKNNIELDSYSLSEPMIDPRNRVSTSGYPVNIVKINLSYTDTYEKTLSFLKYLEEGSKGCYYVSTCNITYKEEGKVTTDLCDVTMAIELYYYDRSAATVATEAATEPATEK